MRMLRIKSYVLICSIRMSFARLAEAYGEARVDLDYVAPNESEERIDLGTLFGGKRLIPSRP